MKSRLSIGTTAAIILAGCWGVGLFAPPVLEPAPPPETEVKMLQTQRPEAFLPEEKLDPHPVAGKDVLRLSCLRPTELKFVLAGLWLRGMSVVASAAPPTGAQLYTAQPRLDVSWSLQGLADEEKQGGEGDVMEYDG